MKTLYLLRHAKSSWSFDELSDQERPLNDRGRDDAPLMGQALAKRRICPDVIVSSPAVRAMSTAVLVAREMQYPHDKIVVESGIYGADVDDFLAIIKDLPDSAASALVVGHNPTITETANALSPSSLNEMPTAAVVCLRFECEQWAEISKVNAEFYFYDYPRNAE
ncbi:SixA phosphatase family protein [Hymenobacter negativus]|uniref:Histidine phosphatase family protein n=1 Tax=Hymenobacter negativus TaxID=2795026 RepID=A0ABS0Q9D5_9BACT|nr:MULTISPECIES: histidine phosphatase family protein [Bacteria]MBH8559280.1 histidine phosphatase family protein [Hymenobacter negativus]MBH8570008.1 histidine phosphatase family protein [Hymenobacter negativus]MBR7209747.1 histidine phosphatase family protein [Microvirga sp. STS02]